MAVEMIGGYAAPPLPGIGSVRDTGIAVPSGNESVPAGGLNNSINADSLNIAGIPPAAEGSDGIRFREGFPDGMDGVGKANKVECQTCANRAYQDGSDDSSVSFQTPTKIDPSAAASKVMSHEREHVRKERAYAERDDREIVSQSVVLKFGICPECGRTYVAGGETTTVSRGKAENESPEPTAEEAGSAEKA